LKPRQPRYIVPRCDEPVDVLHQDDDILVVNKPAFLLSVPGFGPENRDSVLVRLKADYPTTRLIHRLDLDTSGVMVFARHHAAQKKLNEHFRERRVDKGYEAVLDGLVTQDEGEIDLPIAPDWQNRPRQKICHDKGKSALTRYRVLQRDENRQSTRVSLMPVTGRSHQLRIHTREMGHAILGCDLYAPPAVLARSERLLLHAHTLAFPHPGTDEWVSFHSPVPF
jgi:tRNA pseudouridine32 synthase/23S rRNA pseudouridine746 synthase